MASEFVSVVILRFTDKVLELSTHFQGVKPGRNFEILSVKRTKTILKNFCPFPNF